MGLRAAEGREPTVEDRSSRPPPIVLCKAPRLPPGDGYHLAGARALPLGHRKTASLLPPSCSPTLPGRPDAVRPRPPTDRTAGQSRLFTNQDPHGSTATRTSTRSTSFPMPITRPLGDVVEPALTGSHDPRRHKAAIRPLHRRACWTPRLSSSPRFLDRGYVRSRRVAHTRTAPGPWLAAASPSPPSSWSEARSWQPLRRRTHPPHTWSVTSLDELARGFHAGT